VCCTRALVHDLFFVHVLRYGHQNLANTHLIKKCNGMLVRIHYDTFMTCLHFENFPFLLHFELFILSSFTFSFSSSSSSFFFSPPSISFLLPHFCYVTSLTCLGSGSMRGGDVPGLVSIMNMMRFVLCLHRSEIIYCLPLEKMHRMLSAMDNVCNGWFG